MSEYDDYYQKLHKCNIDMMAFSVEAVITLSLLPIKPVIHGRALAPGGLYPPLMPGRRRRRGGERGRERERGREAERERGREGERERGREGERERREK